MTMSGMKNRGAIIRDPTYPTTERVERAGASIWTQSKFVQVPAIIIIAICGLVTWGIWFRLAYETFARG